MPFDLSFLSIGPGCALICLQLPVGHRHGRYASNPFTKQGSRDGRKADLWGTSGKKDSPSFNDPNKHRWWCFFLIADKLFSPVSINFPDTKDFRRHAAFPPFIQSQGRSPSARARFSVSCVRWNIIKVYISIIMPWLLILSLF